MKKILFLIIVLQVLPGCKTVETDPISERIAKVESGLLPAVITNEDTTGGLNIYERMKYYNVPGVSITVIYQGKIEWAKGYGYFTNDSLKRIDISTRFQAASISKPVAAAAALTFVEEGLLDLDRDVNRDLKSWQVPENAFTVDEKVTLRRLLSHTAGLTVSGFGGYAIDERIPTTVQVLNGEEPANSDPVVADTVPGAIYRYSGGGFTVMQLLLCDITGQSFPEIVKERVLSKIGMDNSTYVQPIPDDLAPVAAIAHRNDGSPVEGNWHIYPEMAAAGLWTTPTDLAKFAIELYKSFAGESNRVLSKDMVEQMLTEEKDGYGLGIAVGGENDSIRFGHGGSNRGYQCNMMCYTNLGMGAVIMTNGDQGGMLMGEIYRSLSKTYNWDIYKPVFREIIYPGREVLQEYTGTYEFEPGYSATVTVSDNSLIFKQLWDGGEYPFYPEKKDTLFSKRSNDNLVFRRDEMGEVMELEVAGMWVARKVTVGEK
jgi:CubicO group peptidase (beta-lactamase class C family)